MKQGKIKKSITLFDLHSLLGIQLLRGPRDFIPRHATGALSSHPSPLLHRATGVPPPTLHCYSSAIRLWRSTVWRRAWEGKSQSEGRDEMRCDWLARGGKEGMMQIQYAHPIRNRQMRWPCCHGNAPSAVEYWVWLCWCECYKILNRVWSQTTWRSLVWNVQLPLCLLHTNILLLLARFCHFSSKILVFCRCSFLVETNRAKKQNKLVSYGSRLAKYSPGFFDLSCHFWEAPSGSNRKLINYGQLFFFLIQGLAVKDICVQLSFFLFSSVAVS